MTENDFWFVKIHLLPWNGEKLSDNKPNSLKTMLSGFCKKDTIVRKSQMCEMKFKFFLDEILLDLYILAMNLYM